MICTAWGFHGQRYPDCWTYGEEKPPTSQSELPRDPKNDLPTYETWDKAKSQQSAVIDGRASVRQMVPLYRWEADNREAGQNTFNGLRRNGIPNTNEPVVSPNRLWRYNGAPLYLSRQMRRLRAVESLVKRTQMDNKEIHRASGLLGQLSERLVKRATNGKVDLLPSEAKDIVAVLDQVEKDVTQLHMAAAGLAQAADEARAAYGLEPTHRPFGVVCEYDEAPSTNGKARKVEK